MAPPVRTKHHSTGILLSMVCRDLGIKKKVVAHALHPKYWQSGYAHFAGRKGMSKRSLGRFLYLIHWRLNHGEVAFDARTREDWQRDFLRGGL